MNLALDHYSDNPVIAVLVSWPPHPYGVEQIRACCPLFRKPFIEIDYRDGQSSHHAFGKQGFLRFWQEAEVVLEHLTDIKLIKEFVSEPIEDKVSLVEEVDTCLSQSIAESHAIFGGGMFQLFLDQYGRNCKNLPAEVCVKLEEAQHHLESR